MLADSAVNHVSTTALTLDQTAAQKIKVEGNEITVEDESI
jgi:hypothetical protein